MLKVQNLKTLLKKFPTIYFQFFINYFFATKMSFEKNNIWHLRHIYVKDHFFAHAI